MHPSVYGQYLMARALAAACAEELDVARTAQWLDYDGAWKALGVPEELLESQEVFHLRGNVIYAFWAFDPLPYIARARDLLARFSADPSIAQGSLSYTLLISDLYISILEEDAERTLTIADALAVSNAFDLARALAPIEYLPRLQRALGRAGLELRLADPVPLRRAD